MIEGARKEVETVLIVPLPFITREALFVTINPRARRVLQTFRGSKLALSTSTGAVNIECIALRVRLVSDTTTKL